MISSLPDTLCQGEKICIRRFRPKDAPVRFTYSPEESIHRELPDEVFDSLKEAQSALHQFNRNADRLAYPLVLCVALQESGEAVGHVSLSPLDAGQAEIGYAIGQAHQGRGYGREAARIFSDWALSQDNWQRLYGIVKEKNISSIRCLEDAGYQCTAQEERDCFGRRYRIRVYAREAH